MYAFCLYIMIFLQLIYYLMHIKGFNWQYSCNSLFKIGSSDRYGIMIEKNISYISNNC